MHMREKIIRYFGDKIESHEIVEEVGELIRCKDCKHYWKSAGMCIKAEFPINDSIEPNDYCSRAERRTDND